MNKIMRLHGGLVGLERGLLAFLLLGMLLLAVAQIVLRNFFGSGFIWGDAAVRLMVLWTAMLGAMQAAHHDEHIRIDALIRFFPDRFRHRVSALMEVVAAGLCGLAAWHAARFVWMEYVDGAEAFGHLPSWLCAVIIPIAFAIMALRFLVGAFKQWRGERGESEAVGQPEGP